ncbi:MAG: hypothetical protein WCS51_01595 [Bacilli bacterium]|jgi:galactose mutarotase-like enzyme
MYTIENEILKVTFDEVGAVLTSIIDKRRDKEILYQKDPKFWAFQDVVMFPILGPGKTRFMGKDVEMRQHGFLREQTLVAEQVSETCVRFVFNSTPETLKIYPYDFIFTLTYMLDKDSLKYDYEIKHVSMGRMPFMLGSHTGFIINSKAFLETDVHSFHPLDKDGLLLNSMLWKEDSNLKLTKDLFKRYHTIVLNNHHNARFILHTGDGYLIIYNINAPLVGVWSNSEGGDFVCVEPWWGEPAYKDMPQDFAERNLVQWCKKTEKYTYSISFKKEK